MKKTLLSFLLIQIALFGKAQNLTEITSLKFYEHHSSTLNNGKVFGYSANGSQSGYDFVNHAYYNSFDTANFGIYQNGEEANIDMVEHNGPFGNAGNFGFTSGVSSIWGGDIKGNNTSLWVMASANFNYTTASNVSDLETEYNAGSPSNSITAIQEGGVYISKIRNTNLFVAINCYNVTNVSSATPGVADVYFNFDYKYGTLSQGVGIDENINKKEILIYPNPAKNTISINHNTSTKFTSAKIVTLMGKVVAEHTLSNHSNTKIDVSDLCAGTYFLRLVDHDQQIFTEKLVVE